MGLLGGLWLLARPGRRKEEREGGQESGPENVQENGQESGQPVVEEYASLPAQGEPTSAKEKESVR